MRRRFVSPATFFPIVEMRIVFCFSQLRVTFPTRRTLREETAILRRRIAILCFLIASDNSPLRNDSLVIEHQSRHRRWALDPLNIHLSDSADTGHRVVLRGGVVGAWDAQNQLLR